MSCYISTRDNRFYGSVETQYGQIAPVGRDNQFSAVKLEIRSETELPRRRDKSGTRTHRGVSGSLRKAVDYGIETYVEGYGLTGPRHGFLVQAALGGGAQAFSGSTATVSQAGRGLIFPGPHGLDVHQAVATQGETRFVESVPSDSTVTLNAPLSAVDGQSVTLGPCVTYHPDAELPSMSLYDYWSAVNGVHRILRGAAVNRMEVQVAGDLHRMKFSGGAAELLDSASFETGRGGLTQFPAEPVGEDHFSEPTPGHLGQVWIGVAPDRFYTLTRVTVEVENQVSTRANEFGTLFPSCIQPGERTVGVAFELYAKGENPYRGIYQAAQNRIPIALHLQLGERAGQMFSIAIPSFIPEVPEFTDDEERVLWRFRSSRAQGTGEDEIHAAFA